MSKTKMTKAQEKSVIAWTRRIFMEVEDIELPRLLKKEVFEEGYDAGYADAHKALRKSIPVDLARIQKGLIKKVNEAFKAKEIK